MQDDFLKNCTLRASQVVMIEISELPMVSQIKAECNNKTNLGNHEPKKSADQADDEG